MRKLPLTVLSAVSVLAIIGVVTLALTLLLRRARQATLESARTQQRAVASEVEAQVQTELGRAGKIAQELAGGFRSGMLPNEATATDPRTPSPLAAALRAALISDPGLEEVTFTSSSEPAWQVSAYRERNGQVVARTILKEGDRFEAFTLKTDRRVETDSDRRPSAAHDPKNDLTYQAAADPHNRGQLISTDIHWSEIDRSAGLKEPRVVLTVQRTVDDPAGVFIGVLRVGILTSQLDAIVARASRPIGGGLTARVALLAPKSDGSGLRLVARLDPGDKMIETELDLAYAPAPEPEELSAFYESPLARGLDPEAPSGEGELRVGEEPWLATVRPIDLGPGGTSGWMAAVLVPQRAYTVELERFQNMFLVVFGAATALVLLIGGAMLAGVRGGLSKIVAQTAKMRRFDFTPSTQTSALREVDDVIQGLERAKTVSRAMGKYIPVDLVRRLYASNEEPSLGGELADVSLMFTDIEGFTTLSEKLEPTELAKRLGDYLEAMTTAIERTEGTIDKYIGDAVMALWGAPVPVAKHAARACEAALACMAATRALYASKAWQGLPPLVTRYGLHRATVMVGHFGAPTRLSYTALGDGVNLAARLEPLCKQYGIIALASEDVVESAKDSFVFRRVDRVAVKGKTKGIDVYELLGKKGDDLPELDRARVYEAAFEAYLARDFAKAASLLAPQEEQDAPSKVLAARAREFMAEPPPEGWDGVFFSKSK